MSLHSFAGGEVPPQLAADLRTLCALPESVRDSLWTLLEPNLVATVGPEAEALAVAYCRDHSIAPEKLVPLVSGCRVLFFEAARHDLSVQQVAGDLQQLCQDAEAARVLTVCYKKALPLIRARTVMDTLGRYGAVIDSMDIRMDYIPISRHVTNMVPLAMLSMHYREGDERKRITVQVPASALVKLEKAIEALRLAQHTNAPVPQ